MSVYSYQKTALRNIVMNALTEYPLADSKVIYSHPDAPIPTGTYLTLNIIATEQVSRSEQTGRLDEAGEIHFNTPYKMRVIVSCSGPQCGDVSHSLYQRLGNSNINRDFSSISNISLLNKSPITRNHYKTATAWIEYFNFTAEFYFISHFSESVQAVESIVVEDESNSIIFTIPPT